MAQRRSIDPSVLDLLKDKNWLKQKIEVEGYSCTRIAKELGTTRTTVEKYRVLYGIEQKLSQKELTNRNYQHKTPEEKDHILQRRKKTNLQKYGAENTFQSHRDKIVEVMNKKYGVSSPLQSAEIISKQKQTMCQRYGVEYAVHSPELYQRQIHTVLEKYGTNPAKLDTCKEKARQTSMERYGVRHAMMDPVIASLSQQRLHSLYTPDELHQKAKQTCVDRYGVDFSSQKHLSPDTIRLLNDASWLTEQHHTLKKTLTQISEELNCAMTTVWRRCQQFDIEVKHYFESAQQRELSDWLQSLGINVATNVRNIINGELDIYILDQNIAIEYCGMFWHSDAHERITPNYHRDKLRQCQQLGIRLLTIYEEEWVHKKDIVKQKLLNILNKNHISVYARKCRVVNITDQQIKHDFFNNHHIQGDGPGSITYGLIHDDVLVSMMTFIRKQTGTYELNRYASSVRVVGGFQKLLTQFQRNHEWSEIVSFADLRWSVGDVYTKSGFVLDKILPPDYRYVIGSVSYHKFGFRRQALENGKITTFDPTLSEVQNMKNAGYYRIFNCGLLRYVIYRDR